MKYLDLNLIKQEWCHQNGRVEGSWLHFPATENLKQKYNTKIIISNIPELKYENETVPGSIEKWKNSVQRVKKKSDIYIWDSCSLVCQAQNPRKISPWRMITIQEEGRSRWETSFPTILGFLAEDLSLLNPLETSQVPKGRKVPEDS